MKRLKKDNSKKEAYPVKRFMYVLGCDTESRIIIFYGELKYFPTNALSPCVLLKHNNIKTTQYQIRKTHMHKQKCHYGLW